MSVAEEISTDHGLEKFLQIAIKYYETKYGTPQQGLREKAMSQWLDLQSYKEKVRVIEFMQKQINHHEAQQPKITRYFKPLKQVQEEPETHECIYKTEHKPAVDNSYQKFFEGAYWKYKLEYDNLTPVQIKKMVNNQWHKEQIH